MVKSSYTASDIDVLVGLEAVRAKASMYVGGTDNHGIQHLAKEILDNSTDEAIGGHVNKIRVIIDQQVITIVDDGRGIPTEIHPKTGKSTLETVFTFLHAGAKLFKEGSAYGSGSVGSHGLGASAVSALSTHFIAASCRDKKWQHIKIEKGIITRSLSKGNAGIVPEDWPVRGTAIQWTHDPTIFHTHKFSADAFKDIFGNVAYFYPKTTFEFGVEGKKVENLSQPRGSTAIVEWYIKDNKVTDLLEEWCILDIPGINAVLTWVEEDVNGFNGFISGVYTADGGTHIKCFQQTLYKAVCEFALKNDSFLAKDLLVGLFGVLNITVKAPEFSGQTKSKYVGKDGLDRIENDLYNYLVKWFKNHKDVVRNIIDRANAIRANADHLSLSKDQADKLKTEWKGKIYLPDKLYVSSTEDSNKRELYLVEGESAAGSAVKSRYKETQEILALRGKIFNVHNDQKNKALDNKAVLDILKSIGFDPASKNPISNLRVARIMLLADSDPDGQHITSLLIGLFQKFLPQLFKQGRIYRVVAPLFIGKGKNEPIYGNKISDMSMAVPGSIARLKGWGTLNPNLLRPIAFDPETRELLRVKPLATDELQDYTNLLGEHSYYRKLLMGLATEEDNEEDVEDE